MASRRQIHPCPFMYRLMKAFSFTAKDDDVLAVKSWDIQEKLAKYKAEYAAISLSSLKISVGVTKPATY